MKHGSPEWERDDALRSVINDLHHDLRVVREKKSEAVRAHVVLTEQERRLVRRIAAIRALQDALRDEAR